MSQVTVPSTQLVLTLLYSRLSADFQVPVVIPDVVCQLTELLRGDAPVRDPHLLDVRTARDHLLDGLRGERNPTKDVK